MAKSRERSTKTSTTTMANTCNSKTDTTTSATIMMLRRSSSRRRTRLAPVVSAAALALSSSSLLSADAFAVSRDRRTATLNRQHHLKSQPSHSKTAFRQRHVQQHRWRRSLRTKMYAASNNSNGNQDQPILDDDDDDDDDDDGLSDEEFLRRELARLESLEDMVEDIEEYCDIEGMCDDEDDEEEIQNLDNDEFDEVRLDDLDKLDELFSLLEDGDGSVDDDDDAFEDLMSFAPQSGIRDNTDDDTASPKIFQSGSSELEKALLQGVVPVDAGVGQNTIPGDWGFDPWGLADKDYIQQYQYQFLNLLPGGNPDNDPPPEPRPAALALRDYREAEIRHGRLAMLAVVFWPLQEKLDQFVLDEDQFGPLIYGPVTLPYFPLLMTLIMMLLGYLDIYAKAIQEQDDIGDAFLPGDCFWDPLKILDGAPPSMKRNMQEREITNGRMAMIAFAAFMFEEAASHRALIAIPSNELLFEPLYTVPFIQEWLDQQFG